tara:strand:+ start:1512 stop:1643 length:132 start_codon:yes stop_codon:yes gene_type:complete
MKVSELMELNVQELTTIERGLWKEWEKVSQVLKVVKKIEAEEE